MLKNYDFDNFDNPYEKFKRTDLGDTLAKHERLISYFKIPVVIIIDGWESSGKGYVLNDLIRELDPRLHKVVVFENPTDEEKERPFLWRFWKSIPKKGHMTIFDRSFYSEIKNSLNMDDKNLKKNISDIAAIEKQLYDDDTIIVKFFLHQKESTQQKRIDDLKMDRYRSFLVTEEDEQQYSNYKEYLAHFDKILKLTDFSYSPWHIVSTENLKSASKCILGTTIESLQLGIDRYIGGLSGGTQYIRDYRSKEKPLERVDLSLKIDEKIYCEQLASLQKEASDLSYELYIKKIPTIIVFEGMDAGGKGGAIQRLTRLIDPRSYEVIPVSAPDETEKQYHYLWRFFKSIPRKGRMAIFDRSWYGRVLVERVESFADTDEWGRAYDEINNMEKHISNYGTLLIKFFIYIDKDEQLSRFKARENEADKLYKITTEDWRNREKWNEYYEAINEMLVRTDSDYSPWIIVEGTDKKYARIKVLKEFIRHAKCILKNIEQ